MYDGYLPAITVQNPAIGEQVSSPVTVFGTADRLDYTPIAEVVLGLAAAIRSLADPR